MNYKYCMYDKNKPDSSLDTVSIKTFLGIFRVMSLSLTLFDLKIDIVIINT